MRNQHRFTSLLLGCALIAGVVASPAAAQTASGSGATAANGKPDSPAPPVPVASPAYLIGPDDVLAISIWREPELSGEFAVRPDGRISMLLVNDVQAAGLTTEALREQLTKAFAPFIDAPNVGVSVKQINSRKVYINGNVPKPGVYDLGAHLTVAQLIAIAGGLLDYADQQNVIVIRGEAGPNGQPTSLTVNYQEISKGRNLKQNIDLKPGDTVIVR